jgi:hypothetical protein
MDTHRDDPSDEDLILHHYGEHPEPAAVAARLAASPAAARRYEELRRALAMAAEEWTAAEPAGGYEAELWARLRPRLAPGRVVTMPARHGRLHAPRWLPAAAAALVLLAVGYLAGRLAPAGEGGGADVAAPEAPLTAEARQRLLVGTLAEHLERSERLFTEIDNLPAEEAALAGERDAARELLADNRLYRVAAERGGREGLAALLAELEPVLLELAHLPAEPEAADVEFLRRRIESRGLLFKTRAASELLQHDLSRPARRTSNHV